MTTNVPLISWVNGSPVLPAEADILSGVQADINSAFGGGVNSGLTTPQGQLAQSETAIIGDKNSQIAYIANQVNPATASGIWQDAIGQIYFLSRIKASGTVVDATCTGAVNTLIPAGSIAQDTAGYLYASTADAIIPASGSITVQFQNQTTGPIACLANTLTTIYTAVRGWDTITNPVAGAQGTDVESRVAFENRRALSVAGNSINAVQSVYGAVLSVPNVIDAYVTENTSDASVNFGSTSYPMAAHSITVSVAGGAAADIAKAIWLKKSPGCNYNGNTSYSVSDTNYNVPYPTYTVTWLTPTATPVYFAVQISNVPNLPSNITSLIQTAIVNAFSGADGGPRARIAQSIFSARYYAGILATDPNVQIISVLMGLSAPGATLTSLTLGIDQLPTIQPSQISVTLV